MRRVLKIESNISHLKCNETNECSFEVVQKNVTLRYDESIKLKCIKSQ